MEDYFDFIAPDEIRLKGHRIGIEDVLYEYIHNAMPPDELATRFPTLTLEEIYATLLYYVRNKTAMDHYLAEWLEHGRQLWLAQQANPTPVMVRLRKLRAEKMGAKDHSSSINSATNSSGVKQRNAPVSSANTRMSL